MEVNTSKNSDLSWFPGWNSHF